MYIKAFHETFKILTEIISDTINQLMDKASLDSKQYEKINTLT